jgi:hypothetical protein
VQETNKFWQEGRNNLLKRIKALIVLFQHNKHWRLTSPNMRKTIMIIVIAIGIKRAENSQWMAQKKKN